MGVFSWMIGLKKVVVDENRQKLEIYDLSKSYMRQHKSIKTTHIVVKSNDTS